MGRRFNKGEWNRFEMRIHNHGLSVQGGPIAPIYASKSVVEQMQGDFERNREKMMAWEQEAVIEEEEKLNVEISTREAEVRKLQSAMEFLNAEGFTGKVREGGDTAEEVRQRLDEINTAISNLESELKADEQEFLRLNFFAPKRKGELRRQMYRMIDDLSARKAERDRLARLIRAIETGSPDSIRQQLKDAQIDLKEKKRRLTFLGQERI